MQTSNLNERFQPAKPSNDALTDPNADNVHPVDSGRKSQIPLQLLKLITFTDDKPKMLRFEAMFLEDQGQLIVFDVPNNMMTGSQLLKEKEEFKKLINHY